VRTSRKYTLYGVFLQECQKLVEGKLKQGDEARDSIERGMLKRVLKGWQEVSKKSKIKRQMNQKSD